MKEQNLIAKLLKKKISQRILHKLGAFFLRTARWLFDRVTLACWSCGDLVGMNSCYTQGHLWCWKCFDRHVKPARDDARRAKQEFVGVDYASGPDRTEKIVRVVEKWE